MEVGSATRAAKLARSPRPVNQNYRPSPPNKVDPLGAAMEHWGIDLRSQCHHEYKRHATSRNSSRLRLA